MPLRRPLFVYPSKSPLFPVGGATPFLNALLAGDLGPYLREAGDTKSSIGRAFTDLQLLVMRSQLALASWATSGRPMEDALAWMGLPASSNPLTLGAALLELQVQRTASDDAVTLWRRDVRLSLLSTSVSATVRRGADFSPTLALYHTVFQNDIVVSAVPGNPRAWAAAARTLGVSLGRTLDAAAFLADKTSGVSADPLPTPDTLRAAQSVVLDVFIRHRAGEPFAVPVLHRSDIQALLSQASPAVREMGLALAHRVVD